MSVRYDEPHAAAKAANTLIRWLAEIGISIAGTRALRVRGRKTGRLRGVVINVLTVDDLDYLVSPRPELLRRYLDKWFWEVKGHIAGLTPDSSDDQLSAAASSIPVFALADLG